MSGVCLRYTRLPGTSKLFADYLYDFGKLAPFYSHAPTKFDSFAASQSAIDYPAARRAALVDALRPLNPGNPNLDRLANPGTAAVVTGQQVGLFAGPCYTVYKAATAAALAKQLTAEGAPAVPVFWLATEDHDFPEIAAARLYDSGANLHTLRVTASGVPDRPVGPIVPDGAAFPLNELDAVLRGFEFGGEVMALVREAHAAESSMGGTFRELVRRLLKNLNLVFIDPLEPAVRALGAPLLRTALENEAGLYPKLLDRNRALSNAGYHAQVHVEADTSLFFLLDGGRRIALKRQPDGAYQSKDRSYTAAELASRAEQVSPNALLRPVLQDYLLPTVAYVGGPAEIAYFAQSEVLYRELLGRMPVMLPRNGFTLLDARARKLLARYGLELPDALVRHGDLQAAIAGKLLPAQVRQSLAASRAQVSEALAALGGDLMAFDRSLARSLEKSKAKIEYQMAKVAKKAERALIGRDERAQSEARHLSNLLYPEGHLQERYFSILPFAAQYGLDLVDRVAQHACIGCVDHHVLGV